LAALHRKSDRVNLTTTRADVGRRSVSILVDADALARPITKGDRLAGIDNVWQVLRVAKNGHLMIERELPDPRDRDKTILVDTREAAPHELTHMKRLP
jgi:hypothetical protein